MGNACPNCAQVGHPKSFVIQVGFEPANMKIKKALLTTALLKANLSLQKIFDGIIKVSTLIYFQKLVNKLVSVMAQSFTFTRGFSTLYRLPGYDPA